MGTKSSARLNPFEESAPLMSIAPTEEALLMVFKRNGSGSCAPLSVLPC